MKSILYIHQTLLGILLLGLSEYKMMISLYVGMKVESILSQVIRASFQRLDTEVITTENRWNTKSSEEVLLLLG